MKGELLLWSIRCVLSFCWLIFFLLYALVRHLRLDFEWTSYCQFSEWKKKVTISFLNGRKRNPELLNLLLRSHFVYIC